MNGRFYRLVRDAHLYLGLFSSPFVLVFSITVFFFVHAWIPGLGSAASNKRVVSALPLPDDLEKLSGRELIDALKPALKKAGVPGEIGFVRHQAKERTLDIPVTIPGRETEVTINIASREATIVTREPGLASALAALHKSPGPHGPGIRMNWFYMRAWRWLADGTAYLILFISFSGVYLWQVLRTERKAGLVLLFAGTLTFLGMIYAISH